MSAAKPEIILIGPLKPLVVKGLEAACTVHKAAEARIARRFSWRMPTCARSLAAPRPN